KRSLNIEAQCVASLLHGDELFILNDRPDGTDRAAQSGEFGAYSELVSVMRRDRAVDSVEGEVGEYLAGNDTVQRIGAGDSTECKEFKKVFRGRAQGQQRRAVE